MTHITRRQFVKGSVAAGLGMAYGRPVSRVLGANDEIRVAVVGINGRGGSHISAFEDMEGVRVVALCDVDRKVLDNKAAGLREEVRPQGGDLRRYSQAARKQGYRRDLHRDAEPLALAGARSGPARRARTSTWRSRAATTSSRDAGAWRPPASTSGSCSTARRAAPAGAGPSRWRPSPAASTASCWSPKVRPPRIGDRPLEHRLQADPGAAGEPGLQPLARPGARAAVPRESGSLQLALVLGFRQRRDRQSGRPSRWTTPAGRFRVRPCPRA